MKNIYTLLFFIFLTQMSFAQNQVSINTHLPDSSSILDIESQNQGVLIPRHTKNQRNAITNPSNGLSIYQIDSLPGFYHYNGTNWKKIRTSSDNMLFPNSPRFLPTIIFKDDPFLGFHRGGGSNFLMVDDYRYGVLFYASPGGHTSELINYHGDLTFKSDSSMRFITPINRFEWEADSTGVDEFFRGKDLSTGLPKTIVFHNPDGFSPATPVAVLAPINNAHQQEWRHDNDTLTLIENDGSLRFEDKSKIIINENLPNARSGLVTLVNGTATIANTEINANSRIMVCNNGAIGSVGVLTVTKNNGIGFTINSSSSTDNSQIAFFISEGF